MELRPNPVIFHHLRKWFRDLSESSSRPSATRSGAAAPSASRDIGQKEAGPMPDLRSSDLMLRRSGATTRQTVKGRVLASNCISPPNASLTLESIQSESPYAATTESLPGSSDHKDSSPQSSSSSAPMVGAVSHEFVAIASPPPALLPQEESTSCTCPICQTQFRTPGKQRCASTIVSLSFIQLTSISRSHYHRKHHRRYACSTCDRPVNLQADLRRHQVNVHSKPGKRFVCTNEHCTTPGKAY